ncbi:uncharacterized protein IL334_003524 [Kwoniella shivajii]|uniref:Uncharacterized protein n=1 Tax=Kwoniella shivajii TaxID=564305 RepID=A0ABZ1CXT5_9TREE|nr:hypothetical protein IL334_003524 [Kwoniella shivajii]
MIGASSSTRDLANPSISRLLSLAESQQIRFRLHTPTSVSPLIWTGSLSTSGFSCPNSNIGCLTVNSFKPFYDLTGNIDPPNLRADTDDHPINKSKSQPKSNSKSISQIQTERISYEINAGPYLRHTIVDHILRKSKQTCIMNLPTIEEHKEGVFEDERSPWISTCENLFWCIWDIARRLAIHEDRIGWVGKVDLAIIKHPNHTSTCTSSSTSNLTQQSTSKVDGYSSVCDYEEDEEVAARDIEVNKGPREIWLRPTNVLSPTTYPGEMSVSLKEQYEASRRAASSSGEILFFGRIWAENITSNLEWTREDTPFQLPSHLFQEPKSNKSTHEKRKEPHRWLDELIWDPKTDEYLTAYQKVMSKRRDESRLTGEKPSGPL